MRFVSLIADVIKTYRAAHGISQDQLGRILGLSQSNVGLLEDARSIPTVQTLQRLAKFFGLTAEQVGAYVLTTKAVRPGAKSKRRPRRGLTARKYPTQVSVQEQIAA